MLQIILFQRTWNVFIFICRSFVLRRQEVCFILQLLFKSLFISPVFCFFIYSHLQPSLWTKKLLLVLSRLHFHLRMKALLLNPLMAIPGPNLPPTIAVESPFCLEVVIKTSLIKTIVIRCFSFVSSIPKSSHLLFLSFSPKFITTFLSLFELIDWLFCFLSCCFFFLFFVFALPFFFSFLFLFFFLVLDATEVCW